MQHEPPEWPEQSSEEEDEAKSLATHIALCPTVVREDVSTRSARTGKLSPGDFLQVHEEQMGQKGVSRLRITVVPEVMPEDEYAIPVVSACCSVPLQPFALNAFVRSFQVRCTWASHRSAEERGQRLDQCESTQWLGAGCHS